jgi:cytochrome c2
VRGRKLYESGSPEKLIPGQKMGFSVTEADRTDIIEYLRASK